ncbi:DNA polymerase III subunit gamma/tau [Tuberibacillus sp. Marseille-P3662]|uniref:DNA polymerase III subunit gamma/tau n=1 Tax=Tuberibacillus sp. Marseille-P3662 TaxID=1965358 RepID=UPI000A1C7FBF|nr:DNA polymerase III subunit gamma/tau [Tuberibacillus sp. Marseille-P3662]
MGYQALYRMFRPQTFADMAGQEAITQTLQHALLREKFSHAYLFSGPRGTGKTSAAKLFAKAVNCEQAPVAEPCNECDACRSITNGDLSDVIEMDAASNNGVDEIRDIRETVKYTPSVVRYKVYIIDEVHMLSPGAFNALLKTLEEPPKHVIFILATTEPHKIPLTIISRCQRFDFKRVSIEAIVDRLKHVSDEQSIDVEDQSLQLIAQACEGGMRDALSILDQVVAFSENKVTVADVRSVTGMVSQELLANVVESIRDGETPTAIQAVNRLVADGKDPERFIEDLIFYYRDILLYQSAPEMSELLTRTGADDRFKEVATTVKAQEIYQIIHRLNDTQQEMKWTNHSRVFLEIAMVKLCQSQTESRPVAESSSPDVEALQTKVQQLESKIEHLQDRPVTAQDQRPSQSRSTSRQTGRKNDKGYNVRSGHLKEVLNQASKQQLKDLRSNWADIMERVRKTNVAAHAWLLESKPVASSDHAFLQAFKYDFHCQMVAENKNDVLDMVEAIVQEITGQGKKMYPVPAEQWEQTKQNYIEEKESKKEGQQPDQSRDTENQSVEQDNRDPVIAEAEKLVGSDLLEIKD